MPISKDQARKIADRLAHGRDVQGLGELLAPITDAARPIPPSVPCPREWTEEARSQRVAFVEEKGLEIPRAPRKFIRVAAVDFFRFD